MHIEWTESSHFPNLMKMAGLPPDALTAEAKAEFVSHWLSEPKVRHNQRKWENILLKSLKRLHAFRKNDQEAEELRHVSNNTRKPGFRPDGNTASDRLRENLRKFEEQTDDPDCDYVPNF